MWRFRAGGWTTLRTNESLPNRERKRTSAMRSHGLDDGRFCAAWMRLSFCRFSLFLEIKLAGCTLAWLFPFPKRQRHSTVPRSGAATRTSMASPRGTQASAAFEDSIRATSCWKILRLLFGKKKFSFGCFVDVFEISLRLQPTLTYVRPVDFYAIVSCPL